MFRVPISFVLMLVGFVALAVPAPALDTVDAAAASLAEPTVSPDHSEIAFVSGGDIWSVAAGGGTARLLADTGGAATRPLFSPDGSRIAFASSQAGGHGIDVVDLASGRLRRVTYQNDVPNLEAWSADGAYLYFSTSTGSVGYQNVIRRVPASGGTPTNVRAEAFVNQMDAAPSPDGADLAYVRNGFEQWWRRGHSHIDEGSIVVERGAAHEASATFDAVTHGDAKDRWPMWAPDGSTLYFVSDRSGTDELWERRSGAFRMLTTLGAGRVLWPSISRDGKTIAFERDLSIWTYDTASGTTQRVTIDLRGLSVAQIAQHRTATSAFGAFDLSPDGKKLAFVARGNVFATDAQTGGSALAATAHAPTAADEPVWAKDSRRIAYVVDRGDTQAIATYTFPDGPERIVTPPGHHDDYPHWSPDGTKLEFERDGRELHVVDPVTHSDRVVARGVLDRRPFGDEDDVAFSPGGDWLAYVDNPPGGFANVYVVRVAGGAARAITSLPNTNTGPLAWAPDGKRLYAVTAQRTEEGQVASIDLTPQPPRFAEDTFRHLFDDEPAKPQKPDTGDPQPSATPEPDASPSAAPPTHLFASPTPKAKHATPLPIDFDGIEQRVTLLPTGVDVGRIAVAPDSKTLLLDAIAAGQQNLYTYSVDETSSEPKVAAQLTSSSGTKARARISPDGKTVVFLEDGRFYHVALDGKTDARPILVAADLDIDFERDKRIVFAQAWSTLDRWYADPSFNGTDWNAARKTYEARALAAHTSSEFARIVDLMIGELNSSHSGFNPARVPGAPGPSIGELGADFDTAVYERDRTLRFASLVPLGPLALTGQVKPGDVLLAVNGVAVDPHTDVAVLLDHTIGKRTQLRIAPAGDARATKNVVVLANDAGSDTLLRYRAWVAGRRAYVDRISGGRLGYVHLPDMSAESLAQFYLDLDIANREKSGVVIDIRNNEGGFVDPYALDVLTRKEFLHFRSRFGNDAPERTSLGQRALDRPTVLVVNEHTLSDGENFTEGYRRLHLGTIVGEPTAGWIIFTSSATLADGSIVRVPFTSVFADDGVNMERHPRRVDIAVDTTPSAALVGDDLQLDAAVRSLLKTAHR